MNLDEFLAVDRIRSIGGVDPAAGPTPQTGSGQFESVLRELTEAAAQVKAIRQTAPRYTLAHAKRMFPYPEATERSRLTEALESAGLVAA